MKDVKSQLETSVEHSTTLMKKCDEFSAENEALKVSIVELTSEVYRCEFKTRDNIDDSIAGDIDEDVDDLGCLLIGDIIRSIQSTADDLNITCLSGAKVSDNKKTIKQIDPRKVKYKDLYIVCGANDIDTKKLNKEKNM